MLSRRAFEDLLAAAVDAARDESTHVAVIVAELMGLLRIAAQFGPDGATSAVVETRRRVEAAAGGATAVGRLGDVEFAVLLTGLEEPEEADAVAERLARAFDEPLVVHGEPVVVALAMATKVGPSRRRGEGDLLWRAIEESRNMRSAVLQRMLADVRGAATNLDEVAQTFADQGVDLFALDACEFTVGERSWHAPDPRPEEGATGELPLRAEGRVIGRFRWWGPVIEEPELGGVQILLDHVAASLDRASLIDSAEHRARTDALTGLLNREGLAHRLRDVRGSYAVGVLDLDHFKRVNDEHGHDIGDVVLARLAELLQRGRSHDLVARWGGEEIVIVMPDTTVDGAAARLQRQLEEAQAFLRVGDVGPVTFSGGVTASSSDEPFAEAVRRADEAMYRAKRAGRARIELG